MKYYRCYFLSPANAIKDVAEFECRDDHAAIEHAHQLLRDQRDYPGFELWEGPRLIYNEAVKARSDPSG
jgi:hypothetical protein